MSQIVAMEGSAAIVRAGAASLCATRLQAVAMMSKASARALASSWPFGRRHRLPPQTVKQAGAEPLFQLSDLVAHRRLGDVQLLGGLARNSAERAAASKHLQGIQRGKSCHISSHEFSSCIM